MGFVKEKILRWLRWSEQYTKTDMVYLAKGSGLLGFGQLVSASAGFITALVFANFLPKETYGVYKFILSMAALLSVTTLSGIGVAVTRAVARGFDGAMDEAMRTKFRWGLLGSVASAALTGYYYMQGNTVLALSFFVVALFLPAMEAFGVYDSFLQGKKEFGVSLKYSIASKILSIIALVVTVLLTDNVFLLLLAYFVPFTLTRFVFLRHVRHLYKTNDTKEPGMTTFGNHLSIMGILGVVANQLDKLLVFNFLGATELAAYAIISAPVDQVKALVDNVSKIALPKFSQQSESAIRGTIWRRMFLLLIGLVTLSLLYWIAVPFLFPIFFPQYVEYAFLSQLFGLSIISFALFIPLQILQSKQETKRLYVLNTFASVMQIILSAIAVVLYGLVGVVLARVIARLLNVSIFLIALRSTLQK